MKNASLELCLSSKNEKDEVMEWNGKRGIAGY